MANSALASDALKFGIGERRKRNIGEIGARAALNANLRRWAAGQLRLKVCVLRSSSARLLTSVVYEMQRVRSKKRRYGRVLKRSKIRIIE